MGGVKAGSGRISRRRRILARLLPCVLVAQFCAAAHASAADGQDRKVRLPYAAPKLPPVSLAHAGVMQPLPASIVPYRKALSREHGYRWYVILGGGLILLEAMLIAGLLLQQARQRRARQLLAERLRFESLLSELSARLIPAAVSDVDTEIERGLRQVVEFLRMDRASLREYVPGGATISIS